MSDSEQAVRQVLDGLLTVIEAGIAIGFIVSAFYGWLWLLEN